MTFDALFNFFIAYVLAFFRLAGLMIMAPLFGSARVPKRVKLLFAIAATVGMTSVLPGTVDLPPDLGHVTFAVAGELIFGLAMGSIVSFTFIAAQWAGEMIGQQIGFNLSEVFDPQYGQAGSLVGDLYFMLTLIVFLAIGGPGMLLTAVFDSFKSVPLLTLGFDIKLFDAFTELFTSATTLAMRLAAPMFFTMLVVDLAMGCIGKAMPQFNIMSAGLPIRSILGILVLAGGLVISSEALSDAMLTNLRIVCDYFSVRPTG
ncbi:MAG TPA: flagellar biosynthetic protein FliR [Tepidisphaeraceae bacterium]|jgi:flagellar biosynthetic protein FliR